MSNSIEALLRGLYRSRRYDLYQGRMERSSNGDFALFSDIKEQIAKFFPDPKKGETWRHYKGNSYLVLAVAKDENDPIVSHVVYQDDNGNVWSRPMSNWKELVHDQSLEYCGPRFTRLTSKAVEEQSTDSKPSLHDIERVVSSFMERMEKVIPFKGYFSSPLPVIEQDFNSIVSHMANLEVSLDEANNHIGDLEEQNYKLRKQIQKLLDSED